MRRFGIALALFALAATARAGDGVYFWRIQRGTSGESALSNLAAYTGADAPRPLLLVGEVSRESGKISVRRADITGSPALRALKRPATVVLRVNRHGGDFAADTAWRASISTELRRARDALRRNGVAIDEAQVDFDCPQGRLSEYAKLVSEIKTQFPDLRITVTGMPCWLGEPELRRLLAVVDGWTLQVHLTALPEKIDALPPLCDVVKARAWIARASALGRPFRVALPTYAYLAHFDFEGKFAGIEAEVPRSVASGHRLLYWAPDYTEIATLVRELKSSPPSNLTGFDWYRMPCDDDRLNLTPAAFSKLRRGEAPSPGKIDLRAAASAEGRLLDLRLENTGELDAAIPDALRVDFAAGSPSVYDLPGSRRIRESDTQLIFAPPPGRLRPGESRALGWFRLRSPDPKFSLQTVSP